VSKASAAAIASEMRRNGRFSVPTLALETTPLSA
jgi:hypothetical protein